MNEQPVKKRHFKPGFILLTVLWFFLTLIIAWPLIANLTRSELKPVSPIPGGANYVIVAPQALEETAAAWADYRTSAGYQTRLVLLSPDKITMDEIRNLIHSSYIESGKPYPFYVLLIGHAHPGSSQPESYLPAATFFVDPTRFFYYGEDPIASDDGYIGEYIAGIPRNTLPIFIGRIPVRTDEEGLLLLERTRVYEETPPVGEGRARIELVTSNAGFGLEYEPLFAWMLKTLVQKILPATYQWHMLNGNPDNPYNYPSYLFPKKFASRLDAGSLAMVYIGHGQPELIAWAYSVDGSRGRIFGVEDAELLKNANASLGIFTACSAGDYDLEGDNLSVIESIYLTPGGPVAAYSSSAFINGTANGRLVVDLTEALLVNKAPTIGEWVGQIEAGSNSTTDRGFLTAAVKAIIPRISGIEKYSWISVAKARQVLDIQHATYNLFGDPALRIVYPKPGMDVRPRWVWQPWKGSLAFSGKSSLPAGEQIAISLERIPGNATSSEIKAVSASDRYRLANDYVIGTKVGESDENGEFSGIITIPPKTPDGKYLLRAFAVEGENTYVSAHPVFLGWPPVVEILSSSIFWWVLIGILLLSNFLREVNPKLLK